MQARKISYDLFIRCAYECGEDTARSRLGWSSDTPRSGDESLLAQRGDTGVILARPRFALGRKAWLFAGANRGAERAAAMATLI